MKKRSEKEKERETWSSLREQRNLREKERRMRMKHLYSHLSSLISNQRLPVSRLIDQTTLHMKQLKERVMELKEKKETLVGSGDGNRFEGVCCSRSKPVVNVSALDSTVELNLIIDPNTRNFVLHRVVSAREGEGAEIMSVNLHNMEDRTICTIIAKAILTRIGIEASRIEKKVKDLIF